MDFWKIVKQLMKEDGYTQSSFAEKLGIGARTFQDWIYSNRLPDLEVVKKIADELKVSIDYLVTGENNILSEEEKNLIEEYRKIPKQFRFLALNQIKELTKLNDLNSVQ